MNTINVTSSSINKVIKDIASAWGGTYTQSWEKYTINIPASWGRGEISGYKLNDGMGLLQYDCVFEDDVEIRFMKKMAHPLVLNYCLAGELKARFEHTEDFATIEQYQSLILVNQVDKGY